MVSLEETGTPQETPQQESLCVFGEIYVVSVFGEIFGVLVAAVLCVKKPVPVPPNSHFGVLVAAVLYVKKPVPVPPNSHKDHHKPNRQIACSRNLETHYLYSPTGLLVLPVAPWFAAASPSAASSPRPHYVSRCPFPFFLFVWPSLVFDFRNPVGICNS